MTEITCADVELIRAALEVYGARLPRRVASSISGGSAVRAIGRGTRS